MGVFNVSPKSELYAKLVFESHFKIIVHRKFTDSASQFGIKLLKELAGTPRSLFRQDTVNSDFYKLVERAKAKHFLIFPNWTVVIDLVTQGRGSIGFE